MVITSKKDEAILEFVAVSKFYGSKPANDGLSFKIFPRTIHAIIGENGAGKTTAMKVLFGLEDVTSGQIMFKGRPRPWSNARGALACGVGMVHQHFMLSGRHTALDNVILGQERLRQGCAKPKSEMWGYKIFLQSIGRVLVIG